MAVTVVDQDSEDDAGAAATGVVAGAAAAVAEQAAEDVRAVGDLAVTAVEAASDTSTEVSLLREELASLRAGFENFISSHEKPAAEEPEPAESVPAPEPKAEPEPEPEASKQAESEPEPPAFNTRWFGGGKKRRKG